MSLVQSLPSIKLLSFVPLDFHTIAELMRGAAPLKQLVTLVVPRYLGTLNTYFGFGIFVEFVAYIGVLPIFLYFLAPLSKSLLRNRQGLFLLVAGPLSLMVVFGCPVSNLPLNLIPGFTVFRGLQRFLLVWTFIASATVAWGWTLFLQQMNGEND